jgi:DNA-directed RNA polymerase subunit M/transcription elongation factor TFIIS
MAIFDFNCPQCGNMLAADDEWRGMKSQCPDCRKDIVIPTLEQSLLQNPHRGNDIPENHSKTDTAPQSSRK